jgi:hypothetical protein
MYGVALMCLTIALAMQADSVFCSETFGSSRILHSTVSTLSGLGPELLKISALAAHPLHRQMEK